MKKLLGIFLSVCMVVTMLPSANVTVKAETPKEQVVCEDVVFEEEVPQDVLSEETIAEETVAKDVISEEAASQETVSETTAASSADELVSAEQDGESEEQPSSYAKLSVNGTVTYYDTLQGAINAAEAASETANKEVTLLKDKSENITIKKKLTLDLNDKTLSAAPKSGYDTTNNTGNDFGPLYLQNNESDGTVTIQNGTIKAEIDGAKGFGGYGAGEDSYPETYTNEQIRYSGAVVLNNIKLLPLPDSDNAAVNVKANLWTDGHPYRLVDCDFSQASIQNLNSKVTIVSGKYKDLAMWDRSNEAAFGKPGDTRDYYLLGGTYDQDVSEYVEPGYTQTDGTGEDAGKKVVGEIPVNADQSNVPKKPVILGMTIQSGTEDTGSISIKAEPGVQYTMNSPDGPWYYSYGGNIVRSYTDGRADQSFGKGPDEQGVKLNDTNDIITFLKDKNGNPIQEGTTYTIYAKYTNAALAEDPTRSPAIVSSDAKMTTASAVEIAKLFNQPDENGTDASKKTTGSKLSATNPKVDVTIGSDGKITVILKDQVNGTVTLPDDLGDVTIDLKGNDIVGPAGTDTANGGAAIAVVPTTKEGTTITIIDTADKKGSIKGGDAKLGSGKDGGDGIEIDDQANATVNIGPGVTVIGGNGASSDSQKGGNGGAGVDGTITKNEGTVIGGNGGDSKAQEGGNGGAGVDGSITDVNASTGVITGGNGGSSSAANGGNGGNGTTGDVNRNDGKITGGNGGDATGENGNGGNGGQGAGGNVTTNTGAITGGNGGNATTGKGNGGLGGAGTGGDVTTNTGTITGGNGGNAGSGAGGNGGQGAGGNVSDNTGSVTGGNGGNAGTGSGGSGGSAAGGNVGGSGSSNAGANGSSSEADKTIAMSPEDAELYKNSESLADVEKAILTGNTDKGDIKGSDFSRLRLRAVAKNKAMTLKWKKQTKADGYIIYGSACGSKMKKLKEIKSGKAAKWTQKKLKKGKYYKYTIVAYKKFGGEKRVIAKAIGVHATTPGGKYTNPSAVKLKTKNKITLKKGKSKTIKATYTAKGKVRKHIRIIRFESSNKKIATVSKTGKVKALKKGSCTIFVYAQNGVYKTVKVTVK